MVHAENADIIDVLQKQLANEGKAVSLLSCCIKACTCTYYLVLDESDLARPDFEGAKYVCSPLLSL